MSLFMRFPLGFCIFLAVALFFLWQSRRSYEVSTTEVHFPFRIAIRHSNSVENRMEHRHWICVARSVHAQSVEHRSHFLGRHPAGSTVDDLAAKIGHAHSGESLSRIFRDERRHRLQVFTKLARAFIDLFRPLNQAFALLLQKCKFLLRMRLKLPVWVSINYMG